MVMFMQSPITKRNDDFATGSSIVSNTVVVRFGMSVTVGH